ARHLLRDANLALLENDYPKARRLTEQAAALKPELNWWEDNPDKLRAAIARASGSGGSGVIPVSAQEVVKDNDTKPVPQGDAREQLRQARKMLTEGKLDEAIELAEHIKA